MCNPINPLSQNNEDLMKANVVALVKEEENRETKRTKEQGATTKDQGSRTNDQGTRNKNS